jgi:cystathionine gamma-synthase
MNGHSDVVAGVVIERSGVVTELAWWANNIGVTGGAFDSYLLLRGLRTLSPRMEVAQRNALAIVDYLKTQPLVKNCIIRLCRKTRGMRLRRVSKKVLARC